MKTNEDKCHLIVSSNEFTEIQIGDFSFKNSASEKLLGVNIHSKFKSDCHVNHLCNKANKKLGALVRVTPYTILEKKKIVMNSFLMHSLTTVPLFKCLAVAKIIIIKANIFMNDVYNYRDEKSCYENLLEKDDSSLYTITIFQH